MTNITDIQAILVQVFEELRAGKIEPKKAAEINNTAGKILSSLKVQLAYHALRHEMPVLPFIEEGTEITNPLSLLPGEADGTP